MEPNNLQDLQDLIISPEYPDSEDKAWSIPVQILIDQYETTKYNDALCLGNFSFVLQPEEVPKLAQVHTAIKSNRETKKSKHQKSRGTSTLHFCDKCSKEFSSKTLFIRHLKSHSDEHPYHCHQCGSTFKYSWLRDKHIKYKHHSAASVCDRSKIGGTVYTCEICHKTYPYWNTYSIHLQSHQGIKDVLCPRDLCNKSFRTVSQLNDHLKSHDLAFSCRICSKSFKSRSGVKSHEKKHNEECHEEKCDICGKIFESAKALKMHQRYHSKDVNDTAQEIKPVTNTVKIDFAAHNSNEGVAKCMISCEKVGSEAVYRCDLCPHVRSKNVSTIMSHVCMTHTLDKVSDKIVAKKYQKIV